MDDDGMCQCIDPNEYWNEEEQKCRCRPPHRDIENGSGCNACKEVRVAFCDFSPPRGRYDHGMVDGMIRLVQWWCPWAPHYYLQYIGPLEISLPPGSNADPDGSMHGFHVHHNTYDIKDPNSVCDECGGHMSTLTGEIHGHPTGFPPNRHHGDLGNIERVGNMAHVNIVDPVTTLFKVDRHGMSTMADPGYVGGRSLVLHELIDQFTGPTGYAGDKLGCCHISYPCMPGNVPAGDGTCRPHGWCGDDAHEDDSGNCVCNDPDLDYIDGEGVISVPSCPEFRI